MPGQHGFGGSYGHELRDKSWRSRRPQEKGRPTAMQTHFIHPLQSNKATFVADQAALIHSVDSQALLSEVNRGVPGSNTSLRSPGERDR